jgi:hypothetical protein
VATKPDFLAILENLAAHGVDFIVVGGIAAVLQGAPVATFDLDVVHSRKPANLDRLLSALTSLGARYRTPGAETQSPSRSHLLSAGHQLLMTRSGPLDLLGTIGAEQGYQELVSKTSVVHVSREIEVRVLNLSTLIELKERLARDKDRAMLAILRRTLEEKQKESSRGT